MTCQQVRFDHGECLVEINEPGNPGRPDYTAFVSLLEEGGAIVRPLVQLDGHRIKIQAPTEPLALDSAINFLEQRFGAVRAPERGACMLSTATVGRPVVVVD